MYPFEIEIASLFVKAKNGNFWQMSCNDVDSPLKMKVCYCDVNPALAKSQSIKTPDLCNEDDNKIPCDMRPGFNGTVFNEPYLTFKGTR